MSPPLLSPAAIAAAVRVFTMPSPFACIRTIKVRGERQHTHTHKALCLCVFV